MRVAEADGIVAGLLAWHDESPGVAYLADVQVHPNYQRFGIATRLLDALRDEARNLRLEQVVVRCWEKATWAMAFYRRQRFMPIDATAPAKVRGWKERAPRHPAKPLTRPGEVALWSPIGAGSQDHDRRRDGHDAAHRRSSPATRSPASLARTDLGS